MNLTSFVETFLFPYSCVVCQKASDQQRDLCHDCQTNLPWVQQACRTCAYPLQHHQGQCAHCLKHPPNYDQLITLFHYRDAIPKFISQLKFSHQLLYARLLGELLAEKIQMEAPPDLIIPVPLHKKRLRGRGFNQALELAKPLAKKLTLPVDHTLCQRQRHTQAQSSLPAKHRRANIKNAFIIKNTPPKHIAIVDDVVTTGHTVNELAKTLKQAGAESIQVWSIAKTLFR